MDRNLPHISYECGIREDPWREGRTAAMRDMYKLSVAPEDAPDEPEYLELEFESGVCRALGHPELQARLDQLGFEGDLVKTAEGRIRLSPFWVMKLLNFFGGRNGIGRVDMVENRFVGMKSRGVYETPGGAILFFAHRQIESLTMDREVMHLRDTLGPKYAELVYNGFWFAPKREPCQPQFSQSQNHITAPAPVKLYNATVI